MNPRGDNDGYDIYFEVWRPTGTDGCYSLVGSNVVDNGAPGNIHNVRACIVIDVPEDEQVIVEPGDVVGFYSDHVNGNGGLNWMKEHNMQTLKCGTAVFQIQARMTWKPILFVLELVKT